MKKDHTFQTNEVQTQLSSGKPAFESAAEFTRGIQGSKEAVQEAARAAVTGPAPC